MNGAGHGLRGVAPARVAPSLKSRQSCAASSFCSGWLSRWLKVRIESPTGMPELCSSRRRLSSPRPELSRLGDPPRGSPWEASSADCTPRLFCSDCKPFSHLAAGLGLPDSAAAMVSGRRPSCWRRCKACRRSAASIDPVATRPPASRALY